MTIQGKIRELTAEHMYNAVGHYSPWLKATEYTKEHYRKCADSLLKDQSSKGVVIQGEERCEFDEFGFHTTYFVKPLTEVKEESDDERKYPCADCGIMRSKNEGGTTFTVCDECWDKAHKKVKDV